MTEPDQVVVMIRRIEDYMWEQLAERTNVPSTEEFLERLRMSTKLALQDLIGGVGLDVKVENHPTIRDRLNVSITLPTGCDHLDVRLEE